MAGPMENDPAGAELERPARAIRGRRTLLTPAVQETMVRYLSAGISIRQASGAAGIHEDRHKDWSARGRRYGEYRADLADDDPTPDDPVEMLYLDYYEETLKARAMACVAASIVLRQLMQTAESEMVRFKAAVFILCSIEPETYGPRAQAAVTLTGAGGGPIQVHNTGEREQQLAVMIRQHIDERLAREAEWAAEQAAIEDAVLVADEAVPDYAWEAPVVGVPWADEFLAGTIFGLPDFLVGMGDDA